mmetsp:Transcript_10396/g.30405  ORF Transcript_10396/g.30405 Transcript_10396/m.30405 type:complete len:228 (+) Transcript_10396:89-772(+)|eukprot:CAMPEP_0172367588 /NCGR_PEP_ID=MMETSP1060-20121228/22457_1 /TAXON_ID=37318 /ORGANISM="Pseudo-nitzschia pungens, Strain cf. cingulata" /LENGTH=227 /DNA_ID=CAMNT_0013091897 /DNA_START=37 /DNA_END=720 /DNA_ORIENTATION=+
MTNRRRCFPSRFLLTLAAAIFLASQPNSPLSFSNAFAQERTTGRPDTCLQSSSTNQASPRPELVDQTAFKAAIDRIQDEIEAQYQAQMAIESTPEAERWLADRAKAKEEDQQYVFLVGKLDVALPIDTQPELDLTESIGPLVLVTNVWGRTAEATGMQSFDTITKVGVVSDNENEPPLEYKTLGTPLQETAGALTAAAQHAIKIGKTEIQLEVQRLIKGYYAPEDSI